MGLLILHYTHVQTKRCIAGAAVNKDSIPPLMYLAWELIEEGRLALKNGDTKTADRVLQQAQLLVAEYEQKTVLQGVLDKANKKVIKQMTLLMNNKPQFPKMTPPITLDFANADKRFDWVKETFAPEWLVYRHEHRKEFDAFINDRIKDGK